MLISIISFLVVFTIIALAHEGGHFIWAKRAGIRVFEFGIGFGPRLFSFDWRGTAYSLNLIPILAFVRIAGEADTEEDKACPENERYQSKTSLQKFKTLAAGPLMNIAAALIILSLLFLTVGVPNGASTEIGSINPGSPADKAGLKTGDKLLAINGTGYAKMESAIERIHRSRGKLLKLTVLRQGKRITLQATPQYNDKLRLSLLGFSPKPLYQRTNPFSALYNALIQTASMVMLTAIVVFRLFTGGVSLSDLAGPVGIAQITGKYAQSGLISLTYFTAFISVNIGVLNLLPLPALDGGRIVFVLIEAVTRRPVPQEIEYKVNYWGMIALLGFMALITFHDVLRLLRGQ